MNFAPIARIVIRYVVGLVIGADAAEVIAGDPDVVTLVAAGIGFATEVVYAYAKSKDWAT